MSDTVPTEASQELTNDKIHVSIQRKPHCRIEMTVKAAPALIQEARKAAVKSINKEILIPGFRKGKAPEAMIEKKYPKDIEKELHKSLANTAFQEAQKLANVPVLNGNSNITFDLKDLSPDRAELFFSFETEPTIPSIEPKLFERKPVERRQVGEVEIEEAIRQMRFFFADWKTIQDRPIQKGDYILIDLDTVEEEKTQRVFNQIRFEVSPERMAGWMQKLVIGAKVNDVLEGVSEPDDNATEEEKKEFLPKKIRLTIYRVEEATLPELDDEFAKKVQSANLVEMRESIKKMLNHQADEKEQEELRKQVTQFLIDQYPVEIPTSLIKGETDHRRKEMLKNPKFRKEWDQMSQEQKTQVEEKMANECKDSVALFYLSRQVVNDAKISITHKEVQDEAVANLRETSAAPVEVDKIPREVFALSLSKMILAKAQDYILQNSLTVT